MNEKCDKHTTNWKQIRKNSCNAVRPIHCWCQPDRCQTWFAAAPVCGRLQSCVTTSVDNVALAVDHLARCVSDVGDCMSLSRLYPNSSKTRAIWLGHKNQIIGINIRSIPVLSSLSVLLTGYATSVWWSTAD